MKNGKLPALLDTPIGMVIAVGAVVLLAESLLAVSGELFVAQFGLSRAFRGFAGAVALAAIVSPALYFLVFRRMRENEEHFRQIGAAAQDAIVMVDEQGRITGWNPAAQKVFQYSPEEALGQPLHQLVAPARFHADAERGFARFGESGDGPLIGKITEVSALRRDGSEFPAELSVSAVRWKGGWYAIGIIRDITGRKKTEETLRESEARFHHLFENMSSGVAIYRPDAACEAFTFKSVNRALERIERVERGEVLGRSVEEVFPGVRAFGLLEVFKRVCRGGEAEHFPTAFYRDGRIAGWRENYVYRLDSGEIVAVYDDVTERKQAEDKLAESEERYRSLFENMLEGYAYCRVLFERGIPLDFIYLSVNGAFEKITGLKGVVGKKVTEVIPGIRESNPDLFEIYGRVASTGQPEKFETYVGALGVWFSVTAYSTRKEHFVAVFDDITARKRAEEAERKSQEQLRMAMEEMIGVIAATLEQRDPYTAGHQRRVAELAAAIGKEMGLSRERVEGIHFGGLVHDVGKISVPAEILSKPGRLADIEFDLIKTHAETGYQIVKEINLPWPVADMVRQHHERMDGSGYPQGLSGGQIALESRILAVADVVEAMSASRPYRPGLGIGVALDEIIRGRGVQFDAAAVDACLRVIREKGFVFTK